MKSGMLIAGLVWLQAAAGWAENWPEWRGPTRDGVSTEENVPVEWSATKNVKWKTPLPDRGNSTPVVWGSKIFVTQAIENEGKRLLLCFDKRDGKLLWEKGTLFAEKEQSHETNPQCSASPATDGERVAAWFGSAGLFCYDLEGKELWKANLGKQTHEWGYASSPIIHGNAVYLSFGPGERRFLAALDKRSGKELWRTEVEERHHKDRKDGFNGRDEGITGSFSTPIVVKAGGREELVITLANKMAGFDVKTGKELWMARGMNPLIYASPVFGEGLVLGNGGFMGPDMVVKPGGEGDVTATHRLWEGGRTQNRIGSAVIKDGHIYQPVIPGIVECIELKTGRKVWEERVRGAGPKNDTWSSLTLAGDKLYLLNQSANTIVIKASPKFELVSANSLGNEMCNASIVIADGEILIRTHKHLWCIGAGGGVRTAGP